MDEQVKEFITRCLDADPAKRPTATELLESDFLKHLDDGKGRKMEEVVTAKRTKHKELHPQTIQEEDFPDEEDTIV